MTDILAEVIARSRAGKRAAIPSVCSAHPEVIEASLRLARIRLALADRSSGGLAALVAGLLIVLVLASFLEDAGLLDLLLEAPQRLIQRLVLSYLNLSQTVHPFLQSKM